MTSGAGAGATRTLRVLRFLTAQPEPVAAERITRELDIRSATCPLLQANGRRGLRGASGGARSSGLRAQLWVHLTGAAAADPLARSPVRGPVRRSAHLAVPQGCVVILLVEERSRSHPAVETRAELACRQVAPPRADAFSAPASHAPPPPVVRQRVGAVRRGHCPRGLH